MPRPDETPHVVTVRYKIFARNQEHAERKVIAPFAHWPQGAIKILSRARRWRLPR